MRFSGAISIAYTGAVLSALTVLLNSCTGAAGKEVEIPVIRANSYGVDIRDGDEYIDSAWTIAPEINPDVYTSSSLGKYVTFYTDMDSISVLLRKDTKFDFIILVNDSIKAHTQVAYKPSYLETLKAAGKYDNSDDRSFPDFTYQSADAPELIALKQKFNLDSIAGGGSETARILNLLRWMHELVPHDGQKGNPEVKNAMSMIDVCRLEKRGLNCRGLAMALNECYLAIGIRSRYVTCLPMDTSDTECHVINSVYASDRGKWIWIDPTNNAYVMDEKGELLGIAEVREKLISGKTLILNPDANWNRRSPVIKENYLDEYMAKNLYRLECPVRSEYDTETKLEGKTIRYVQLVPTDYFVQKPDSAVDSNKNSGTTFVTYRTSNAELFWKKP